MAQLAHLAVPAKTGGPLSTYSRYRVDCMPEAVVHKMERVRRFPTASNMADLCLLLKQERFTGNLRLRFSQGGLIGVHAEDSQAVEPDAGASGEPLT